MSDTESNQAYNDASEASIPAENGSREVENDPPPLGRAEESVSAAAVAARTRYQRRLQNVAGADIIDPARIADPPTRSDHTEETASARAAESSASNETSSSLIDHDRIAAPPTRSDPPEEFTSARAAESSASPEASSSLHGVAPASVSQIHNSRSPDSVQTPTATAGGDIGDLKWTQHF